MATENQINANRKNALKSTGPRTEEGKEASAQNAIKHGLRAKRDVIRTENQDEFVLFREKMIADISPDGAMEEMLAERIISLSWRLKRAEHFQNAVIDALIEHGLHGASSGFGWTSDNRERAQKEAAAGDVDVMLGIVINHDFANAKTLDMLLSYERRIESSLYRTIAELKKVRRTKNTENRTQDTEAHDSSSEVWHPQSQIGDALDLACHLHPEKGVQDEAATHLKENRTLKTENRISQAMQGKENCTNEPNFKPEYRTQDTASRESSGNGWHPQAHRLCRNYDLKVDLFLTDML
jgi:hypothetical protein